MTTTSVPNQATPSPARRVLVISLAVIAALVAGFFLFANFFAEFLWFGQLGFESVLITQWVARAVMFVIGFVGMAVPVWVSIQLAYRLRPVYARLSSQLDRYQEVVEPLRRLAMWGIPIFFGFFAGFSASSNWQITWMWFNGVATDVLDPQFGVDTGFYMFAMPFYTALLGFASAVVLISLLVSAVVLYLYGSVRAGQRELRISKAARIQIAILAGLYLALQAVSLFLDRFKTLIEPDDRITGPGYTGANAIIPGLTILSIVAAIVAVLFIVTAIIGRWRYPLIATALLVITALVLNIGYPWAVNTFQVRPNQLTLQSQYFERNMAGTQAAYGIDGVEKTRDYQAKTTVSAGQLREDADTTASIRLMDPAVISPAVRQKQQYRPYYRFQDPLDVDRYTIDGKVQDVVVSVRELNMNQIQEWQNQAIVYTHGYGMVAAAGNQRTAEGDPVFEEYGIPTTGVLTQQEYEPRIYFGEFSPEYSIVGGPDGVEPREIDYPQGATEGANEAKYTFSGDGGPRIGGFFSKLIYALKFQSEQILFSDYVNTDSQILYDRNPSLRVSKVAPYLTLDSDPYPSVVDGRIVWIIDGYTTSSTYPYSTPVSLSDAIADANNTQPRFAIDNINYIRNSVKATVDAYDGKVTLYAWDDEDPILKTWQNIYPTTVKPISDMTGDLMSHVRYPTDLFKVQRTVLGTYHVDSAQSFFQQDNVWTTPNDPNNPNRLQSPYYMTMKMPSQEAATYSMFTSFIPNARGAEVRNVLTGYLAVDADAGTEAGKKSADYGKLRLLVMDADTTVPGPGQVRNNFDADETISGQINLLNRGTSEVLNGNLLTLPVGGGLLYVQPVYVQSSGDTQLPRLRKVLAAFGEDIVFEDTLSAALDKLFGGDSGAQTGDETVVPVDPGQGDGETTEPGTETGTTPDATPAPTPSTGTGTTDPTDPVSVALNDARQAMQDRDAALKAGDWTKYGEADARLTDAIQKLLDLEG